MGCGGSSDGGAKPRKGGKANKKKKPRKKGKGSAMMVAEGKKVQDSFWDDERFPTSHIIRDGEAIESKGKATTAYVQRHLEEREGARFNFSIKQTKDFDFQIGLHELRQDGDEDSDFEDDEETEFEVHNSHYLCFKSQKVYEATWDSDEMEQNDKNPKAFDLKNMLEDNSVITMALHDGKAEFAIDDQDLGVAFQYDKKKSKYYYPVVLLGGEEVDSDESEPDSDEDSDAGRGSGRNDKNQVIKMIEGHTFDPEAMNSKGGKKKR